MGSWLYVYSKYYIECLSWTELSVDIPFGKGSKKEATRMSLRAKGQVLVLELDSYLFQNITRV